MAVKVHEAPQHRLVHQDCQALALKVRQALQDSTAMAVKVHQALRDLRAPPVKGHQAHQDKVHQAPQDLLAQPLQLWRQLLWQHLRPQPQLHPCQQWH